ncbi:MAG: shikimate kinase [Candidatus Poribacteria bacterium]|nr:shikimate kinase [Candidatus Poribacteria bacterium]
MLKRNPNIVLVGFMGTGKTSISKRLSSQLRMRYVDTDSVIEKDSQRCISDIFEQDGETVFRQLESEAVNKVSKLDNHVISTGGGVVLREANVAKLKENGIVFCLIATPEEIYRRVGHQTHRPLLQTPDPLETIRSMLTERAPFYAQADHTVETTERSFEEIIADIKRIYLNTVRTQKKKHTPQQNGKNFTR